MLERDELLSGSFLNAVVRHSRYVGLALALVGTLVTRDWRFVLALAIGSTVDIASLTWMVDHGEFAGVRKDLSKAVLAMTGFRLVVKSVLITAAALIGPQTAVWGMILGVLVVEITLMTVGIIDSIRGIHW